jgi:hypothetical protein
MKTKLFFKILWMIFLPINLFAQKVKVQIEYELVSSDTIKKSETYFDVNGRIEKKFDFGIVYETIVADTIIITGNNGQDSMLIQNRTDYFSDTIAVIQEFKYDIQGENVNIFKNEIRYDIKSNRFDSIKTKIQFTYLPNHIVVENEFDKFNNLIKDTIYYQDEDFKKLDTNYQVSFNANGQFGKACKTLPIVVAKGNINCITGYSKRDIVQVYENFARIESCKLLFEKIEYFYDSNTLKMITKCKKNGITELESKENFLYEQQNLVSISEIGNAQYFQTKGYSQALISNFKFFNYIYY